MNRVTLLMAAGVLASTSIGLVAARDTAAEGAIRCLIRSDVAERYRAAVERYDHTDSNDPRHQRAFMEAHRLNDELHRIDSSRPISEECPR